MITKQEIQELTVALHRKLLNINSDLRKERKSKYPDKFILSTLKEMSKRLDTTLSATKQLYNRFETQTDPDILYQSYNQIYRAL